MMNDKREQLKEYLDDLNSKLDSQYEVKLDSSRILILMYNDCYFEVTDYGLRFTHVHYEVDDVNPALLKLATMVSEYYFDLTDKWYEESAFRDNELKEVNKFVERVNDKFAQSDLSIEFSELDNQYVVYEKNVALAIFNEDKTINLFDEDINMELVDLLKLIELSGVFL